MYNDYYDNDFGPAPFVIDIAKATQNNDLYRLALWTGMYLQATLMSIPVGGDVGLESHPATDQFFRVESGTCLVQMGDRKNHMYFNQPAFDDCAIFIPAGTWHNIINTGNTPLKLYSIYAPPNHPWGAAEPTKEDADAAEGKYNY
jgi:mannose-6-phosphate isomerase-like protein (cupin superfamily)